MHYFYINNVFFTNSLDNSKQPNCYYNTFVILLVSFVSYYKCRLES